MGKFNVSVSFDCEPFEDVVEKDLEGDVIELLEKHFRDECKWITEVYVEIQEY